MDKIIFTEYDHLKDREVFQWGSYGKYGDKPIKYRLLKDLSDSHLLHIIEHIKINLKNFGNPVLRLMEEEARYRTENLIFVDEYK